MCTLAHTQTHKSLQLLKVWRADWCRGLCAMRRDPERWHGSILEQKIGDSFLGTGQLHLPPGRCSGYPLLYRHWPDQAGKAPKPLMPVGGLPEQPVCPPGHAVPNGPAQTARGAGQSLPGPLSPSRLFLI